MGQFNRGIWNFHLPFDSWPPSLCLHHHFLVERLFSILAEEAGTLQKTKKNKPKNQKPKNKTHQQLGLEKCISFPDIHTIPGIRAETVQESVERSQHCLRKVLPKILGVFTSGESSYLQCFEFIHVTIVICYSISEKQSVNEWGENGVCLWVCLALWH